MVTEELMKKYPDWTSILRGGAIGIGPYAEDITNN